MNRPIVPPVLVGVLALLTVPLLTEAASRPNPLVLSRRQAVQQALSHNPLIQAAQQQVAQAKAQITIARAIPDPAFVSEVDQESSLLSPGSGTEKDVGLSFIVPYPYRLHLNGKIARAGWKAAQLNWTLTRQQVATQTAKAYDALLVALRHRDDLQQGKALSQDFLNKTEARFNAGTAAKLDVIKAKVDLARAETDLLANDRAIATARATLNQVMGLEITNSIQPAQELALPNLNSGIGPLEDYARRHRPELQSLRLQQGAAHDATRLAKQYWVPDLDLTLWRSFIHGAPEAYKFDGGFNIPLFFWQHQKGEVAQAKHREQELQAVSTDLMSQVLLDVRTAYASATTARRQALYLQDHVLPEAQAAYQRAAASYGLGGSSALEWLDAKRTLLEARGQYTDALGAANDAAADLQRAIGLPVSQPLSSAMHETPPKK